MVCITEFLHLSIKMQSKLTSEIPVSTSESSIAKMKHLIVDELLSNQFCDSNCSICKEHFELKSVILTTLCKHTFHKECLIPWFKISNKCPNCRTLFD